MSYFSRQGDHHRERVGQLGATVFDRFRGFWQAHRFAAARRAEARRRPHDGPDDLTKHAAAYA